MMWKNHLHNVVSTCLPLTRSAMGSYTASAVTASSALFLRDQESPRNILAFRARLRLIWITQSQTLQINKTHPGYSHFIVFCMSESMFPCTLSFFHIKLCLISHQRNKTHCSWAYCTFNKPQVPGNLYLPRSPQPMTDKSC